jgi:A/G-specific adenine glycosylase
VANAPVHGEGFITFVLPMPVVPNLPDTAELVAALHAWHGSNVRDLAFRRTRDPWAVLVAEVMAQQTQVARVDEAWARFLGAFPTPHALAAASTGDAIRAWAGLGYNRRAVNLHRAARTIVERHGGVVPGDLAALEALPGVGPYTARAVAACAFGMPVAPIDTNIRRVIGRLAGPGALPTAELQQLGDRLVDRDDPAAWTHAMMDLGATVCRPIPACARCPFADVCRTAAASPSGRTAVTSHPQVTRFEATSRWLRGRIVARLRDAPAGSWVAVEGPIGQHDPAAVRAAISGLERDGVLECAPDGSVRLPSTA